MCKVCSIASGKYVAQKNHRQFSIKAWMALKSLGLHHNAFFSHINISPQRNALTYLHTSLVYWTYFWAQEMRRVLPWLESMKLFESFNYLFGIPITFSTIFHLTLRLNLENMGTKISSRSATCNICRTVLFMFNSCCNISFVCFLFWKYWKTIFSQHFGCNLVQIERISIN